MLVLVYIALALKLWMLLDAMRRRVHVLWYIVLTVPFGEVIYFFTIKMRDFNVRPLPDITLTLSYSYRDGSGLIKTAALSGDLVLKMDDDNIPKDGYQTNSWSGFCSYNTASGS